MPKRCSVGAGMQTSGFSFSPPPPPHHHPDHFRHMVGLSDSDFTRLKVNKNESSGFITPAELKTLVTQIYGSARSRDHQLAGDFRKFYYIFSFLNRSAAKPVQGDEVALTELYSFISSFILPYFYFILFLLLTEVRFLMEKKNTGEKKKRNNT